MNNKLFLFFLTLSFTLALVMCKTQPQELVFHPQVSWEQVQGLAKQYGLQNSITQQNSSGLVYMKPEEIEKYMRQLQVSVEIRKEMDIFLVKNKDIRTFDDYCKLMDALPNYKKIQVESHGGETQYQEWVQSHRNIQWHIYRDSSGMLTWINPRDAHLNVPVRGERIDNKLR